MVRRATPAPVAPSELTVTGLRVRFGGVVAVDGIDLSVPTGRITGLIGPNGAGKTTTFDAVSGLNKPTEGMVLLNGRDLSRHGVAARARLGIGRTFQRMELFDSSTVARNVELGYEGSRAGVNPVGHVLASSADRAATAAAAAEAMDLCGISQMHHMQVGSLSTGQRRLVELARCLAGPYSILLLDEPSSGLDREETRLFGLILQKVVRERGVGILLVEHDMSLVAKVCDYIYVLDFGKPIFQGTPSEVINSAVVRAAYLGDDPDTDLTTDIDVDFVSPTTNR